MPKLVAIGDSLTQGVQSGAIYKTKLSYPALIAEAMGLTVRRLGPQDSSDCPNEFRVPKFPGGGIPLNIEKFLRNAHCKIGDDIDNLAEWWQLLSSILPRFVQKASCLYDGGRSPNAEYPAHEGVYHNLAVSGFRVFDSFSVHARYCSEQIAAAADRGFWDELGFLTAPMYRIAERVLNPTRNSKWNDWTQIDNLRHLNAKEGGVENLILFLGANDCLGTVVDLEIKDMGTEEPSGDPEKRRDNYNLTSKEVFEDDYRWMVRKISEVISEKTKVFVGTVPHVTIPPITQGIWGKESRDYKTKYAPFYGTFFANDDNFKLTHQHLKSGQVRVIDERIDDFNSIIKQVIHTVPKRGEWHLVDICALLDELAVKRNLEDDPKELLQRFFQKRCMEDHCLLGLDPVPSVLRFETKKGERTKGGFFSLDCIHPTTIGYGLIAEEFLRVMKNAEVCGADPNQLCWKKIIERDSLIQTPPELWDDIIQVADRGAPIWSFLVFEVFNHIIKLRSR